MKNHSTIGKNILFNSKAKILQLAEQIAETHHEKWDGSGYPKGLSGEHIPISGRIVALADVFDALISERPYKKPYPINVVLEIIKSESGHHFDPKVVDAFFDSIDEIKAVLKETNSQLDSIKEFLPSLRDQKAAE